MPELVLGPLLRFTSATEATVWVEVDEPCSVEVLGATAPTFSVEGHHYALLVVDGLAPGREQPYEVRLDGVVVWPDASSTFPPSVIRTLDEGAPLTMAFGSCRVAVPHEPPWNLTVDEADEGFEHDALRVLAQEMIHGHRENWPDYLLLLGDQIYVDLGSPTTRAFIRSRRDTDDEPGEEAVDYEEFSQLYREAWSDPVLRWLFSTVSVGMIWDDHDMGDDWNISRSWVEEMDEKPWWHERRRAGFIAYWIHQHVGNLSPAELEENELWCRIRDGGEVTDAFDDFARSANETADGVRWSHARDFGPIRMVVIETRAGRVMEADRRRMVDDDSWSWLTERIRGDVDHLVLVTTDPYLLMPSLHDLEAWSERVCAGAWGKRWSDRGEKLRRDLDFDHWASFGESFAELRDLLRQVASGRRGVAPASISVLSGDVHHAYLAEVDFGDPDVRSPVVQAVCSPMRNPLDTKERRVIRFAASRLAQGIGWLLRKTSRAPTPGMSWEVVEGPWFENQVGTLHVDGRHAEVRLDKTLPADGEDRRLERVFTRTISG